MRDSDPNEDGSRDLIEPAEIAGPEAGPAAVTLSEYLREISRIPRLSPEEEQALARRVLAGDAGAEQRMIEANLHLVVAIARRYRNRGLPLPPVPVAPGDRNDQVEVGLDHALFGPGVAGQHPAGQGLLLLRGEPRDPGDLPQVLGEGDRGRPGLRTRDLGGL